MSYWIFSNKAAGTYGGNVWDMETTSRTKQYYLDRRERNRARVVVNDIGFLRVYGRGYLGHFRVGADWEFDADLSAQGGIEVGFFAMADLVLWPRPVPQSLVIRDLSNQDVRSRLISITERDAIYLECAQRIYERLGFGTADGEIVLLEKGLEEAIKPNLAKMGLHLAHKDIQEQFSMGPGVGRSDLICTDKDGDLVVIELKRGRSSNEVVGQVLTYMGFVRENIAKPDQKVHGWIITGDYDEGLRLAASQAGITLRVVRLP